MNEPNVDITWTPAEIYRLPGFRYVLLEKFGPQGTYISPMNAFELPDSKNGAMKLIQTPEMSDDKFHICSIGTENRKKKSFDSSQVFRLKEVSAKLEEFDGKTKVAVMANFSEVNNEPEVNGYRQWVVDGAEFTYLCFIDGSYFDQLGRPSYIPDFFWHALFKHFAPTSTRIEVKPSQR